jgi:RHS repeat-associated protein
VSTEYSYDAASRITELVYKNLVGTLLGNLTYQYDGAGNRRGMGGSLAQTLLPDPVTSANYDTANRQLQFGERTMTYDLAGNLTSIASTAGVTTLNWDARHRLTSLTGPSTAAVFSHDVLGRRRSKQVNGQATQFLYDGLSHIAEKSNNATNGYLASLGIDEPWVRNNSEFYLADALGTIVGLTDASGGIINRYNYEPYGKTALQGLSSNPFQFTGRENDLGGLYYYRARYYSPELHRFISEDPIDLQGGDTNYYSYAWNSPISNTDPLGLKPPESKPPENTPSCGAIPSIGRMDRLKQIAQGIGHYLKGGAHLGVLLAHTTALSAGYGVYYFTPYPVRIPLTGLIMTEEYAARMAARDYVRALRQGTALLFPPDAEGSGCRNGGGLGNGSGGIPYRVYDVGWESLQFIGH